MKIDILDIDRLIVVNKLQEITSPWLMSNKMMYDSEGILSSEIFGISKADRRGTFAYIDLVNPYIHPHIYGNILRRSYKKIISIISGQIRCNIVNGEIVDDVNGWTGILDLYKHWPEIDWNKSTSSNKTAITLLKLLPRDRIFIKKLLICPPAYRDVMLAGTVDTSDHVDVLNKLYVKVIRSVSLLKEGGLFARTQHSTHMKVQTTLVEILDHLKEQISKKYGIIRRYLIGKNVTYGTRSVISAFSYNNETIQENIVDISHSALPISQCCSAFYPLIEAWIKNFFTMEILTNPSLISFYDENNKKIQCKLKDPELQFSDKSIKKLINDYLFNPDNRFKFITLKAIEETKNGEKEISCKLILKGKKITKNNTLEELNRYMTITDVLYLACVDVCEKRHIMVTRYPIGTDKGLFFNKIRVRSTRKCTRVLFNDKEYPYYPDIDLNIKHDMIGVQFIDTLVYSNSLIEGMGEHCLAPM
jgi:hypothetical protein